MAASFIALQLGVSTSLPVWGQTQPTTPADRVATRRSHSGNLIPDKWEASVLGGGSFFDTVESGLGTKQARGGALGLRAAQNLWRYVGIEEAYTYSPNNLTFKNTPRPGDPVPAFGVRLHHWDLSGLFYFTPRGSKFRPYVSAGMGAAYWVPTSTAQRLARSPEYTRFGATQLSDTLNVMGAFGIGMKYFFLPHVGLQLDAREIITRNPTFILPDVPFGNQGNVYIPRHESLVGVQTTAGLVFATGDYGPITCTMTISKTPDCPGGQATAQVTCNDPAQRYVDHIYSWTSAGGSGQQTMEPTYGDRRKISTSTINIPVAKQGPLSISVRAVDTKANGRFASAQAQKDVAFAPITLSSPQFEGNAPKCQGDRGRLRVTVNDTCGGGTYRFTWNGIPGNPTTTTAEVEFNAESIGNYNVTVSAVDTRDESRKAASTALDFTVVGVAAPVVSCTANPATLDISKKQTSQLTANATSSECTQITTYQWSLNPNEGTLSSPTSAQTTYDPSTVRFEGNNQEKRITANVTVTDNRNQTATCTQPVVMTVTPGIVVARLPDLIFSRNGSRVNNCGKRILWDEVLPKLQQGGLRVVLVGHFDKNDETPSRRNRRAVNNLDRLRAVNAGKALVAGPPRTGGTRGGATPGSIQVYTMGGNQTSDLNPGLCGASNRQTQRELRGSTVTQADQNRRVEVYIVPEGSPLPEAIRQATPVTASLTAPTPEPRPRHRARRAGRAGRRR